MMWLGQIAQAMTSGVNPDELIRLGLPTNPVYALDLAFALPYLAASGLLLLRSPRSAAANAFASLVWIALMGLGVSAIFVVDAAAGAAVVLPVAVLIACITCAAVALAAAGARRPGRDSMSRAGAVDTAAA